MLKKIVECVKNNRIAKATDSTLLSFLKVRNIKLGGNNIIYGECHLDNVSLGRRSYIGGHSCIFDTEIGAYTSIGSHLRIVRGQHPTSVIVSTHPCFYSDKPQFGRSFATPPYFEENRYADRERNLSVIIGNDVWIGDRVMIIEGVKIGDGAIIATGAVVTKDVDPYSIVGGVPAKVLKMRFLPAEVEFLLKTSWWKKDEQWIYDNRLLFKDIKEFVKSFKSIH